MASGIVNKPLEGRIVWTNLATTQGANSITVDDATVYFISVRNADTDATYVSCMIERGVSGNSSVAKVYTTDGNYSRTFTLSGSTLSWTASTHPSYPNNVLIPQQVYAI